MNYTIKIYTIKLSQILLHQNIGGFLLSYQKMKKPVVLRSITFGLKYVFFH
jgi:hypothetical protein